MTNTSLSKASSSLVCIRRPFPSENVSDCLVSPKIASIVACLDHFLVYPLSKDWASDGVQLAALGVVSVDEPPSQ